MRGYCESCAQEVESERDMQGADVCPICEDDVHPGVHVEAAHTFEGELDVDFDEWLIAE